MPPCDFAEGMRVVLGEPAVEQVDVRLRVHTPMTPRKAPDVQHCAMYR